jgi:hypothetical protein
MACDFFQDDENTLITPSPQAGISAAMDSMIPPAPPAKVEAAFSTNRVLLTWIGTGTDVDQFYKIYQRKKGGECWQLIGVKMIEGDNKGGYQFEITAIVLTGEIIYAVTTVDIYGNESIQSIAELSSSGS